VVTLMDIVGIAGGGERLAMEIAKRLDPGRFERIVCFSRGLDKQKAPVGASERAALNDLRRSGVRILRLKRSSRAAAPPRFASPRGACRHPPRP
jgi:hypothetical protein